MNRQPPPTGRFAAVALALATVAVSLLLLEGALRVFRVVPVRHERPRWLTFSGRAFVDGGFWGEKIVPGRFFQRMPAPASWGLQVPLFVPGAGMKLVYDSNPRGYFDRDNGVEMWINELGYRGPPAGPKQPDVFRILGLGDSFAFGEGVRFEDTFLRLVETALKGARAGPQTVEVLNLGMGGYSIEDEIVVLEKKWLPMGLAPDLVLITFYVNDAVDGIDELGKSDGNFLLQEGLGRFSYLWDLVSFRLEVRRMRRRYEEHYGGHRLKTPDAFLRTGASAGAQPWQRAEAKLRELRSLARQRNFAVAVVIFPDLHRLRSGHPFTALYGMVENVCKDLGFPVLNLYPAFAASTYAEEDLWVHPADHHPNEVAHAIAAGEISRFVARVFLR